MQRIKDNKQLEIYRDNWFAVMFYESVEFFHSLDYREKPELLEHYKNQMKILFM
jgi:hypothetical protein